MFHVKHFFEEKHKKPYPLWDCGLPDELRKGCESIGISLTPGQFQLFKLYHEHLLSWNHRVNLISKQDEKRIVSRHFLDALAVLPVVRSLPGKQLLDLGTGAGFPGLPLRIAEPEIALTLLESKRKKTLFLRSLLALLDLSDVAVLRARAEALAHSPDHRGRYDIVTARAVAPPSLAWKLAKPFLRPNGSFICYADPAALDLSSLSEKIRLLVPSCSSRILVLCSS